MSGIFEPRRLGHVNLFVDDLDRSTRFYNETCGLAIEFSEGGLKAQFLGTGNTPHDVGLIETTKGVDRYGKDGHLQLPGSVGRVPALNHIAWEVATEAALVQSYRKLTAAGWPSPRVLDHQIAHSIYIADPDGNPVEFYADMVRDWRSVMHGEMDLVTSLWRPGESEPLHEPLFDPAPELREVAAAPLHPRRLTHVVLVTEDVDRLARFYTEVAGLAVRQRVGERVYLRGRYEGAPFHLVLAPAVATRPGLHHFAFELADEAALNDAQARLAPAIERRVEAPHKSALFLRDPDGMRAEFYVRRLGAAPVGADPFLI